MKLLCTDCPELLQAQLPSNQAIERDLQSAFAAAVPLLCLLCLITAAAPHCCCRGDAWRQTSNAWHPFFNKESLAKYMPLMTRVRVSGNMPWDMLQLRGTRWRTSELPFSAATLCCCSVTVVRLKSGHGAHVTWQPHWCSEAALLLGTDAATLLHRSILPLSSLPALHPSPRLISSLPHSCLHSTLRPDVPPSSVTTRSPLILWPACWGTMPTLGSQWTSGGSWGE